MYVGILRLYLHEMEEENLNFACGEGDERVDRKLRKGQVNAERLAHMFGVSSAWINMY